MNDVIAPVTILHPNYITKCTLADAETLCKAFPNDLKDSDALYGEIKLLGETISENSEDLKSAAKILRGKEHLYPNLKCAYILALTIPISVASNERSFSKLKIVKTYLRTTMKQERLDSLMVAACSVDVLDSLDLDELADKWSVLKTRRLAF